MTPLITPLYNHKMMSAKLKSVYWAWHRNPSHCCFTPPHIHTLLTQIKACAWSHTAEPGSFYICPPLYSTFELSSVHCLRFASQITHMPFHTSTSASSTCQSLSIISIINLLFSPPPTPPHAQDTHNWHTLRHSLISPLNIHSGSWCRDLTLSLAVYDVRNGS